MNKQISTKSTTSKQYLAEEILQDREKSVWLSGFVFGSVLAFSACSAITLLLVLFF
jgi:hypothetical protein